MERNRVTPDVWTGAPTTVRAEISQEQRDREMRGKMQTIANAAREPVKVAAQAMIEDKVFHRCSDYGDLILCTAVNDRLVMLRDKAFTSSECEAPGVRRSHSVGGYAVHTCVLAKL
jgi:hypothetical protein